MWIVVVRALEFEAASNAGIPRLVFLLDDVAAVPIPAADLLYSDPELQVRQRRFRQQLSGAGIMVARIASPDQLELELLRALQESRENGRLVVRSQTLGRVFVSYRRADSAPFAGRPYGHLQEAFGVDQVFMDVGSIEPDGLAGAIEQAVASCEVLLVLIGPGWLDAVDHDGKRRIDDPYDSVRLAIETALRNQLRVISVLIDGGAVPPRQSLPLAIQGLASRNAMKLRAGNFRYPHAAAVGIRELQSSGSNLA